MLNVKGKPDVAIVGIGLLALMVALLAVLIFQDSQRGDRVTFDAEYQMVALTNGAVYFGKIEKTGSRYLVLTDVYYIQDGVDEKTKKATSVLVKRGKEWHEPERMVIPIDHILLIEPVGSDSTVAKLIAESKKQ
jgi:hypothetical protein